MKRRDATVLGVSVVLAVIAVGAVALSLVLDRRPKPEAAASSSSLLVLTWAPSLCKVEPSNSGCRSGHVGGMGQSFVLHGLWPQPASEQYCDVPKQRSDRSRARVALPDDLSASLQKMMSDSSVMTTHEWYAHGTCSGVTPTEYFGMATTLAQEAMVVVDPVFDRSAGREVTVRSVREAFEARYGRGAGERVALACKGKDGVAYEVRISLPAVADLRDVPGLGQALAGAPTVPPGCGRAQVP